MSRLTIGAALAALVGLLPAAADAHPFVQPYTLPVPVWMYLYGSVATLVVSFAIIGYFVSTPGAGLTYRAIDVSVGPVGAPLGRALLALLRALSVGGLLLCIVAGFVGTRDPFRNINMTLFWILFVLGLTYVTALIGNVYALVNPWKLVIEGLDALGLDVSTPQVKYPERLGYYPALLFYFGLIWLEIFFHTTPYSLSIVLLVYSLLTLAGTLVFGKEAWFRYGEFFSVFLRLVGMLAPVEYRPDPARGRP